jgi:tight adherence protein B
VTRVLLWIFGITLVVGLALEALTRVPLPLALVAGAAVGIALPVAFLHQRKVKRVRLFEEQLPGALDLLVRSLRVGHPLTAAIAVVAQELPDPAGSEFGLVVDEVTYGLDLPEAVDNMNERIDLPDLRYLTVAISIQYASGGNLAEILSGLSKVIRERFQLFRKARAITAEGRISAWFLSVFPFLIILGIQFMRPGYYTDVADYPYFRHLVALTVVLLALNIFYMRAIVKLKV